MGKTGTKKPNQSKRMKEISSDPAKKAEFGKASSNRWADPEYNARVSRAISLGQKKRWSDQERKKQLIESRPEIYGKEHMVKMATAAHVTPEQESQRVESFRQFWKENPDERISHGEKMTAIWTDENRKAQSDRMTVVMSNPEEKVRRVGFAIKGKRGPNKLEQRYIQLLDEFFPSQWRYTGGGRSTEFVGEKCPDFIGNESKKIIEIFGTYWHRNQNPQDRIDYFAKHGHQTIVIWESENPYQAMKKIEQFSNPQSEQK